jgi:hypothetical protein
MVNKNTGSGINPEASLTGKTKRDFTMKGLEK